MSDPYEKSRHAMRDRLSVELWRIATAIGMIASETYNHQNSIDDEFIATYEELFDRLNAVFDTLVAMKNNA